MSRPYKCPICEGRGLVPNGFYSAIGVDYCVYSNVNPEKCRSCNGTGIIWSNNSIKESNEELLNENKTIIYGLDVMNLD